MDTARTLFSSWRLLECRSPVMAWSIWLKMFGAPAWQHNSANSLGSYSGGWFPRTNLSLPVLLYEYKARRQDGHKTSVPSHEMPKQHLKTSLSASQFLVVSFFFWQVFLQRAHLYISLLGIEATVLIPSQRNMKPAFKNIIAMFVYEFKGPAVSRATYVRGLHASLASACATKFPAVQLLGIDIFFI